jgi:hypothetical protein
MFAERERENLLPELVEPRRMRRDMDGAGFDGRGLSGHAHDLVAIRIDGNGIDTFAV